MPHRHVSDGCMQMVRPETDFDDSLVITVFCWFMFQVAELEAQSGVSASSEELTQTVAEMEALIRAKDEVKIA